MNVVNAPRAARRGLSRSLLGQSALALLVVASACTPALSSHDDPKPKFAAKAQPAPGPGGLAERASEPAHQDRSAPLELAPAEAPLEEAVAAEPAAPPAATVAPSPTPGASQARASNKAAASPSFGAGGLGLSGIGAGGGGRGVAVRSYGAGVGRLQGSHMARSPSAVGDAELNTENYAHVAENKFLNVADQPLSTFSIDVDTASYSNARRFLNDGSLPPKDAIRVEEWLNYFGYDYPEPVAKEPFSVTSEVSACPWNAAHRLVRLGLKSQQISQAETPARNLVFLVDVSGSMMPANKLPLLKRGLALLAENLRPKDTISIAVYAGASGLALPATTGSDRGHVLDALGRLEAGGSTNGGDGIRLAYQTARQHFIKGGINRVILATDGDFNVGLSEVSALVDFISEKRKT
ncbi:MAG: von Willebrand factor type A domain-containing protein, partial [Polyangiaceae bacterium]